MAAVSLECNIQKESNLSVLLPVQLRFVHMWVNYRDFVTVAIVLDNILHIMGMTSVRVCSSFNKLTR